MKREGLSIDLRTVVILLIVVNVPLWAVAFFTVDQARNAFDDKLASDFRAIVKKNALTINYAINHLLVGAGTIAINPVIREIVRKQNNAYGSSFEEIQKRIKGIDKIWLTPQANSLVEQILSNPASKYLRQFVAVNPSFKRITVTDRFGAVAAANLKTVDYEQADEAWWRKTFKDGLIGSVVIEDVKFDPITKINSLHIAVPIQEENQELVIGTIGSVIDISDLFPLVSGVKIGSTGETLLVKEDGTVISGIETAGVVSPSPEQPAEPGHLLPSLQEKIPYMDDIKSAMHATTKPDFILATAPGGHKKVVAFTDTGLSSTYPDLKWMTIVAQDRTEAHAAVNTMIRNLLWAALIVLVIITALALYLSTHRRLEFIDLREVETD
jgi:Cache domain